MTQFATVYKMRAQAKRARNHKQRGMCLQDKACISSLASKSRLVERHVLSFVHPVLDC
jgi:hypothetical protein